MTKKLATIAAATAMAVALSASTASAQFAVFDPANYANALLRYAQLGKQLTQLVNTYEEIRTQYELLLKQSQRLPFDLASRYLPTRTPWDPLIAASTYGLTTPWLNAANSGLNAVIAFSNATERLAGYGSSLNGRSPVEAVRIKERYDRTQLQDGIATTALEAIGRLRMNELKVEAALRNLETDSYSSDATLHTQISVLNKINAADVAAARISKDTNYLLASILEQQLMDATEHREAAAQAMNAQAAFFAEAAPLEAASTAQTTEALSTFRIP